MLNFERLRALHAVASHGSVHAAASALHVTTSAVSQQIAKLEDELGQTLLERSGRGVRLTDAASVLVAHTEQVLSLMERAEAAFDAQRDAIVGRITVAAFPTAMRGLAPRVLSTLSHAHPELRVVLKEREPADALPLLVRGEVDLVVAQDWSNAPLPLYQGLSKEPLLDDRVDVALPTRHRLAARSAIHLDDLASEPWISWREGSTCHDWLVHTLRSRGHEPLIAHMAGEHATQLALVAAGAGICIIPRLGRDPLPRGVKIARVRPALARHVYALWREESTRRRAIRVTLEAFRASAAHLLNRAA